MKMVSLLDLIRTSVCLLFLTVASMYDIKNREVPDIIWIIFAPLGLILTSASMIFNNWSLWTLLIWVSILGIISGLSIAVFYLGLFGGADAKALMCLAIAMPYRPDFPWASIGSCFKHPIQLLMPPPISTFNNAVTLSALSVLPIIARNLVDYVKNKRIFEGLEHESFLVKVLAFLTGYRVDADKLRSGRHHYLPMEEFIKRENGSISRKLKVFSRLPFDKDWPKAGLPEHFHGKIWITPGLPFIVFITLGFLVTILVGDLITILVYIIFLY